MRIMYNNIAYGIDNKLNTIYLVIHLQSHCFCISHNLTCTFASTQVNATDIAAHCDTMSQKRNLNPLYWFILIAISGVDR